MDIQLIDFQAHRDRFLKASEELARGLQDRHALILVADWHRYIGALIQDQPYQMSSAGTASWYAIWRHILLGVPLTFTDEEFELYESSKRAGLN
jgi:hypothetical protein